MLLYSIVDDKKISVSRTFRALGTANSIYIPNCGDKHVVELAVQRVLEIDNRMSVFKKNSDIFKVNAGAGYKYVPVYHDTMELLKRAVFFSRLSEGAFDITSAPLISLWGIENKSLYVPGDGEIKETKKLVGYGDLIFDEANCAVMLKRNGQSINLGGIAKGYAADEVRRILLKHNIQNALINLGGNLIAMGMKSNREYWNVGVQDPSNSTGVYMGTIEVRDETLVTSGSNEQYFIKNGYRYHHILDPRTGTPASTGLLSVTAVGNCSMDMDALTTAVFVMGMEKGMELIRKLNAQAIFVDTARNVFITDGLQNRFSFAHKAVDQRSKRYNCGKA